MSDELMTVIFDGSDLIIIKFSIYTSTVIKFIWIAAAQTMRSSMLTALASVSSYTSGDLSSVAQVASACSSVLSDPTLITPAAADSALQVNSIYQLWLLLYCL